ncbi:MAG: energy transducer TonB [Prevotella sp.]|nr:energy transducer TonB [Prevotella sp.]
MTKGKSTCKTLKDIRKRIAQANDIVYEPHECRYEGPCLGTCPACEAEVRYLENQLSRRRMLGRAISLLGVSAGFLTACAQTTKSVEEPTFELLGDVENVETWKSPDTMIAGVIALPEFQVIDTLPATKEEKSKIFGDCVEQQPMFRGGQQKLLEYLEANVRYPESLAETCAQGRVVVSFMVEKDGSITGPKVVKSVCPELDAEALRVVSNMPKWLPGKQNGTAIRVKYTLPVIFRLQ